MFSLKPLSTNLWQVKLLISGFPIEKINKKIIPNIDPSIKNNSFLNILILKFLLFNFKFKNFGNKKKNRKKINISCNKTKIVPENTVVENVEKAKEDAVENVEKTKEENVKEDTVVNATGTDENV